jgi:hypothetical protein
MSLSRYGYVSFHHLPCGNNPVIEYSLRSLLCCWTMERNHDMLWKSVVLELQERDHGKKDKTIRLSQGLTISTTS